MRIFPTFFVIAAATAGTATLLSGITHAADHAEAPLAAADPAADIADIYAWHEGDRLYAVMTVAGAQVPTSTQAPVCDPDVLYAFHIDNDGDSVSDADVLVRFGTDSLGNCGVQFENLPGASGTFSGPVGETLADGAGPRGYADLRDDPFFFDLQGFNETVDTASLQFASLVGDGPRDSIAGTNATAIVVEMDLDAALDGGSALRIWGTTARK